MEPFVLGNHLSLDQPRRFYDITSNCNFYSRQKLPGVQQPGLHLNHGLVGVVLPVELDDRELGEPSDELAAHVLDWLPGSGRGTSADSGHGREREDGDEEGYEEDLRSRSRPRARSLLLFASFLGTLHRFSLDRGGEIGRAT
ncbi:hypothetical protein NL676_013274 [Syzygium grande]|nr:hypothetical protein NL676_013274 [Syzygium grande]